VFPALLTLLTFGAAITAVLGVYSIVSDLYLRDRSRVSQRVDDEFRKRQRDRARKSLLVKDFNQLVAEAGTEGVDRPTLRQRFESMVDQSGLEVTPRKVLTIAAATGLGLGAIAGLLRQSIVVGAVAAVIGAAVPVAYVQIKRKARLEKLLSQLPDAFDLMGRVIRAGQTMSQALMSVADEFPQPIAGEFSYCYEQQNLGLPPEMALRDLARRTGLVELKIFVLAMVVQQQTGGNLAEMLDKLSAVIRERYKIRGQIKSLTAEGRMQAVVLLALPPAMFLIMLVLNRNYAVVLLDHPTLIMGTLACEGIGALWIRQIVNFDF
jgi:tight adherence protein B